MKNLKSAYDVSIDRPALDQILNTIGSNTPETCGIFGSHIHSKSNKISHFSFVSSEYATSVEVMPDRKALTDIACDIWEPMDIALSGLIHSHPGTLNTLTQGDFHYFYNILFKPWKESGREPRQGFVAPILNFERNNRPKITTWILDTNNSQNYREGLMVVFNKHGKGMDVNTYINHKFDRPKALDLFFE